MGLTMKMLQIDPFSQWRNIRTQYNLIIVTGVNFILSKPEKISVILLLIFILGLGNMIYISVKSNES